MKLIYALIFIPLILIGLIVLDKIVIHQSIGSFSILAISALLFSSLFAFLAFLLHRLKKWELLENICLAVLSSILTYIVIDLVTGYLLIQPLSPPMIPDPYVHHKMLPNTFSRFKTKDFDHVQRVNNIGLRGRDIKLAKGSNVYRILMLGDSFTMGKGVQDDETFSALVEKSFESKNLKINGKMIHVVNAGINSYSPILSFLQLQKELGQLRPDLVVLNFDMSDLIQETAYRRAATYGTNGEIIGVDGKNPWTWFTLFGITLNGENKGSKTTALAATARIKRLVNRHLYITRLLLLRLNSLYKRPTEINVENSVILSNMNLLSHTLLDDEPDRKEQWQNVFDSIVKIKVYCGDHDIDFLLTVYPWGHQVNGQEWATGKRDFIPDGSTISDRSIHTIQVFALTNGIELLNVFPAFRSYSGTAPLYFNHDMHWTPQGHKLMAKEVEQFLIRKYSVSP